MTEAPQSAWTATARNALSQDEMESLLGQSLIARLATYRLDGFPHLTPVWFLYDDGCFYFTLGARRRHLRNLRRDPRATLLVDFDERPTVGAAGSVKAVMASGNVELEDGTSVVAEYGARIDERYSVGDADDSIVFTEMYTLVRLMPLVVLSWDFAKG